MADLPAGIVTFLFTDVEGSTRLFERYPQAYRDAVTRHHVILKAAVEAHGGRVFETVGDAVYAAFAFPPDAVVAALQAQLDLHAEPWGEVGEIKVRMGLHTGEIEVRDGRYFGAPLYRCEKLMSTGYGRQVVLSAFTADLVRGSLPAGTGLHDLGQHRLREFVAPEQVYQLVHPALPAEFPPLKSLSTLLDHLPAHPTSFVGRQQEIADVKRLLSMSRLLTLSGPGGIGKTRLAHQVATEALDGFPDGVWPVDLAVLGNPALADPTLVALAVAASLQVQGEPGRPLPATLLDYLRPKQLLLVLDGCERLLDACATWVDSVLRACPHVRVLATSRTVFGIAGETAWRVPPLGVPGEDLPAGEAGPVSAALASDAVRLFADRAAAALPGFAITEDNALLVAHICRQVEGVPLAIEQAAARLKDVPAEQLAGHAGAPAPEDWGYHLLDEAERTLLNRLSVITDGWTLEAAEAIGAGDGIEDFEVLDLLAQLVEKSVIEAQPCPDGVAHYWLPEALRRYGLARLAESGEAEVVERRYAEYLTVAAAA
jgi:predicted ATPase/class 3 adenylate cyclase